MKTAFDAVSRMSRLQTGIFGDICSQLPGWMKLNIFGWVMQNLKNISGKAESENQPTTTTTTQTKKQKQTKTNHNFTPYPYFVTKY